MNWLHTCFILGAAFLAVFGEAAFDWFRLLIGAQVDVLPALMVYTSLSAGLPTVALLAFCGGLWFDSLSANPLGISILPLFAVGFAIYVWRGLLLRDQLFPQMVLGLGAGFVMPVLTLLLLLSKAQMPLLGWGSVWQLLVMSIGSAAATPCCFLLFSWLDRTFFHTPAVQTSFRPDREIRRGR